MAVMANKVLYSNKKNTVSLCMWGLTSQKIPMMQRVLQLFTVKGICSIMGDIQ